MLRGELSNTNFISSDSMRHWVLSNQKSFANDALGRAIAVDIKDLPERLTFAM